MNLPRSLTICSFILVLLFASCGGTDTNQTEKKETALKEDTANLGMVSIAVDRNESIIKWKGEILGMYAHEGTVKIKEAYVSLYKGELFGGGFILDMKSIEPTDENFKPEEGKSREKLTEHLNSPDFFDTKQFSFAMFDIHEVKKNSLVGELYLKGKKNIETVENFVFTPKGNLLILTGTMTINRKDYGVSYDNPVKDMVISDDIILDIKIVTTDKV